MQGMQIVPYEPTSNVDKAKRLTNDKGLIFLIHRADLENQDYSNAFLVVEKKEGGLILSTKYTPTISAKRQLTVEESLFFADAFHQADCYALSFVMANHILEALATDIESNKSIQTKQLEFKTSLKPWFFNRYQPIAHETCYGWARNKILQHTEVTIPNDIPTFKQQANHLGNFQTQRSWCKLL